MHSVIFKNDAVGDLVHSLPAINNVIFSKQNKKITIFLSARSRKFKFLINEPNVEIKILNYDLNIIEKTKILIYLIKNNIDNVYILSPKKFYFFLPLLFRKIKFYAICINNINNYKRPNAFLRKFLFKYTINERQNVFKRESTKAIQNKLTSINLVSAPERNYIKYLKKSDKLINYLPKDYVFFHYKKERFDSLSWKLDAFHLLLNELSKHYKNIVFTKDNLEDENNHTFKNIFNSYDFKTDLFINKKNNILFLDNIEGYDLFNVIGYSGKVVAFHGMMTNIASLFKKPVLDLFHFNIKKDWESYRRTRNFFYEFKPTYKNYDFIIPKKNINKTIIKMRFSLK